MRNIFSSQSNRIVRTHHDSDATLRIERAKDRRVFGEIENENNMKLAIYTDKNDLPVTYEANTEKTSKSVDQDDLSVLWHEILSPLTVIKGYTRTMLELNESITEEQKKEGQKSL